MSGCRTIPSWPQKNPTTLLSHDIAHHPVILACDSGHASSHELHLLSYLSSASWSFSISFSLGEILSRSRSIARLEMTQSVGVVPVSFIPGRYPGAVLICVCHQKHEDVGGCLSGICHRLTCCGWRFRYYSIHHLILSVARIVPHWFPHP